MRRGARCGIQEEECEERREVCGIQEKECEKGREVLDAGYNSFLYSSL